MQDTRFIHFANNTVALRAEDEPSSELLRRLFGDVMTERGGTPCATVRVFCRDGGTYHGFCNDDVLYIGRSPGNLAPSLMDRVLYNLADKSTGGLVLHAGAVRRDDRIVLLPGNSGSGKSSLSAWLTTRGFSYLTDEMVFVPEDGGPIETFTRPINIKTKGFDVVRELLDVEEAPAEFLTGGLSTLVPHRRLNDRFEKDSRARIAMVVFPKYREDGEGSLRRLTGAQCAQQLMEVLVNARNIEGHGLQRIISLAKEVPAYAFEYSAFGDISDQVLDRLEKETATRTVAC